MSIFNIQTGTSYDTPKSFWNNGNSRASLKPTPQKISNNVVAFSDTGFPLFKNKIPLSSANHSSSLRRGPLYIINLQTSSLL